MGKIVKKLGGQHFKEAKQKLQEGDMASTIDILLTYYDKAYLDSINKRKDRIQLTLPWNGGEPGQYARELIREVSFITTEMSRQ